MQLGEGDDPLASMETQKIDVAKIEAAVRVEA